MNWTDFWYYFALGFAPAILFLLLFLLGWLLTRE